MCVSDSSDVDDEIFCQSSTGGSKSGASTGVLELQEGYNGSRWTNQLGPITL